MVRWCLLELVAVQHRTIVEQDGLQLRSSLDVASQHAPMDMYVHVRVHGSMLACPRTSNQTRVGEHEGGAAGRPPTLPEPGVVIGQFQGLVTGPLCHTPICPTRDSESVEPCRPVVVSLVADGGRCLALYWVTFHHCYLGYLAVMLAHFSRDTARTVNPSRYGTLHHDAWRWLSPHVVH